MDKRGIKYTGGDTETNEKLVVIVRDQYTGTSLMN